MKASMSFEGRYCKESSGLCCEANTALGKNGETSIVCVARLQQREKKRAGRGSRGALYREGSAKGDRSVMGSYKEEDVGRVPALHSMTLSDIF